MPTTERHADALRAPALRTMRTSPVGDSQGKGGEATRGSAVQEPLRAFCTRVKNPAIKGYVRELREKTTWCARFSHSDQLKTDGERHNIPPRAAQDTPTSGTTYPQAGELSTGPGWGYVVPPSLVLHSRQRLSKLQAPCMQPDCTLQGWRSEPFPSTRKEPDYLQGSGKDLAPRSCYSWGRWNAVRSAR